MVLSSNDKWARSLGRLTYFLLLVNALQRSTATSAPSHFHFLGLPKLVFKLWRPCTSYRKLTMERHSNHHRVGPNLRPKRQAGQHLEYCGGRSSRDSVSRWWRTPGAMASAHAGYLNRTFSLMSVLNKSCDGRSSRALHRCPEWREASRVQGTLASLSRARF